MTKALPVVFILAGALLGTTAHAAGQLRYVERAVNEKVVDLGAKGDSIGDLLVFLNPLYDADNRNAVGTSHGYCVRIDVGVSWECTWTMKLAAGTLAVHGTYPDEGDSDFAITGGTGRYAGARGALHVHARDTAHTSYDFTIDLR
jgi:hypothetical protein